MFALRTSQSTSSCKGAECCTGTSVHIGAFHTIAMQLCFSHAGPASAGPHSMPPFHLEADAGLRLRA